jgi:hypothetical protein
MVQCNSIGGCLAHKCTASLGMVQHSSERRSVAQKDSALLRRAQRSSVVTAAGVNAATFAVYPLPNMLDFTAKACRQYVIINVLVHIWFGQAELQ